MTNADPTKIRLQLAIAQAGLMSRRHAEDAIKQGRVTVDGKIIKEMGVKVNPSLQQICVDSKPIPTPPKDHTTIILHKPTGYLSAASDGHGRPVVTELVSSIKARLVPVGRLDYDSSGLLIMSDDGDLISRITHPRYGHTKTYLVTVSGNYSEETLQKLQSPMEIDGYHIRPVKVAFVRTTGRLTTLRFILTEGRNRQIRKMCEACSLRVTSLIRIAVNNIRLGTLPEGKWRHLTKEEIATLKTGATN